MGGGGVSEVCDELFQEFVLLCVSQRSVCGEQLDVKLHANVYLMKLLPVFDALDEEQPSHKPQTLKQLQRINLMVSSRPSQVQQLQQ